MKILPLGLLALGLLTAPLASFGDVMISSFETGLEPWSGGEASNEGGGTNTYGVTTVAATEGTSSAEAVMQMTSPVFKIVFNTAAASYSTELAQATGIQADVYFEWANMPTASGGGAYYGMSLNMNSANTGYTNVNSVGANLTNGQWTTITWPLTPEQATQISDPAQGYAYVGFLLNAGAWGAATVGGTITIRVDRVVVLGAAAPTGPSAPTNLAATGVHAGVNLSWTASADTLFYTVKRSTTSGGPFLTIASNLTATSYSDTGLAGNTTYYYVVTASNANGEGAASAVASATTENDEVLLTSFESGLSPWFTGPDTILGGGSATYGVSSNASDGSSSAEAVWQMTGATFTTVFGTPVANYQTTIAQSTGIKADVYYEWADRPPTTGTGGAYIDLNLSLNHQNGNATISPSTGSLAEGQWRTITWNMTPSQVAALTANGQSYANLEFLVNSGVYGDAVIGGTLTVRLDKVSVIGFLAVETPPAPTGLVATGGAGQISLTWNASAGATGYTVRRATVSGGPYTTIASGLTATAYTETGLAGGTTHYYVIVPTNAGGDGAASAEASATASAPASGLASWRQTHFGTTEATGNAANDADPDADGIANLLEYALGGDPLAAESDLLPMQAIDAGHLKLSFSRIADPALTYAVQASDDLASWTPVWSSTGTENTEGVVSVTDPEALSAHARRFLRLHVTAP